MYGAAGHLSASWPCVSWISLWGLILLKKQQICSEYVLLVLVAEPRKQYPSHKPTSSLCFNYLQTSYWAKQVTCQNPKSKVGKLFHPQWSHGKAVPVTIHHREEQNWNRWLIPLQHAAIYFCHNIHPAVARLWEKIPQVLIYHYGAYQWW